MNYPLHVFNSIAILCLLSSCKSAEQASTATVSAMATVADSIHRQFSSLVQNDSVVLTIRYQDSVVSYLHTRHLTHTIHDTAKVTTTISETRRDSTATLRARGQPATARTPWYVPVLLFSLLLLILCIILDRRRASTSN